MENPIEWITSRDTGASSVTIWALMMGFPMDSPSVPLDSGDFGRCSRLLEKFPEWRKRLGEVGERYPAWKPLAENWSELETLYRQNDRGFQKRLDALLKMKVEKKKAQSYVVELLKRKKAVQFGNFILASGQKSNIYVDIKTALVDPAALRMIANAIVYRAHRGDIKYGAVAGVAVGGVPLAVAASMLAMKPYIIIRKDEKGHGLSGKFIGLVPTVGSEEQPSVLLVEDVTTTGGSVCEAVRVLRKAGATVNTVITVVDRDQGAGSALAELGVKLVPLVEMKDLMD